MLPKKIIFIGVAHPLRGGIATFNERLSQEIIKEVDGVDLKIYSYSLQYPKILFPGKTQYSSTKAPENLRIISAINSINPFNWWRVGRQIRREKPDLVLVKYWIPFMGPNSGFILRQVKKNKHTKIICVIDNMVPHEKRIGDKWFTQYFVKPVDAFIAMSDQVMDDLSLFDKTKPRALSPHPIYDNFGEKISREQALKNLKLDPEYRYVLFFGIIREYKGLDLLLKAFGKSNLTQKKVKLIVAGEYYEKEEKYTELIDQLGIKDQVIIESRFIPNDEVASFFCASDLVAQPYKSATQSGVTQIAYHFEISMLVTNVGGLPEIVPHNKVGYVVEQDPEQIADAIADFYDNDRQAYFEEQVRHEKKRFEWGRMLETISDLYQKL